MYAIKMRFVFFKLIILRCMEIILTFKLKLKYFKNKNNNKIN